MRHLLAYLWIAATPYLGASDIPTAWDGSLPEFMRETAQAEAIHDEATKKMYVLALQHIVTSRAVADLSLAPIAKKLGDADEPNSCFVYPFTTASGAITSLSGPTLSLVGTLPRFTVPGVQPTHVIFFERPRSSQTLVAEVVFFEERWKKSTDYRHWYRSLILHFQFTSADLGSGVTLSDVEYVQRHYR